MDSRCLQSRLLSSPSLSNFLPNSNTKSIFKSLNPYTNWKYTVSIRWHVNKHSIITDSCRSSISLIYKDIITIPISQLCLDGTRTNEGYLYGLSSATLELLVIILFIINLFGSSSVRSSKKTLCYLSISTWVFLKNLVVYIGPHKKIKFLPQLSRISFFHTVTIPRVNGIKLPNNYSLVASQHNSRVQKIVERDGIII